QNGIYLSTDRGESWEKRNSWISGSPQYYQEIICDPINPEKAYFMDTYTKYTTDGGKTLKNVGLKYRHVDDHSIWIDPKDTRHYIIGGDGGLYETYDDGIEWRFFANLPLGQFYRIQSDNKEPFYWVYGGTQDNSSWGGPSQTNSTGGITNDEWFQIVGGDGYEAQIDPTDPNIVYGEFQYGGVVRMDRRNGELKFIQPQPKKGEMQRFNWDTPLLISRYDPKTIYIASNILWKSTDRGDSWTQISPDLTRQMDRNKLKIMDKIWNADAIAKSASTSLYGNIVSLCESPLNPNLLFVGTDDGLIQITEDGGKHWTKIEKVGGLPELIYVSDIFASN
ncbi:MAG TPA: glycosyl hydrolase, partial [Bacteroidota bacterium]|nr:glycosyl hydrolase [Bacteroidota bacterium]